MPSCPTSSKITPCYQLSTIIDSNLMQQQQVSQQVRATCGRKQVVYCIWLAIDQISNWLLTILYALQYLCFCIAIICWFHVCVSMFMCQDGRNGSVQASTSLLVWRPTWPYQQRLSTMDGRYCSAPLTWCCLLFSFLVFISDGYFTPPWHNNPIKGNNKYFGLMKQVCNAITGLLVFLRFRLAVKQTISMHQSWGEHLVFMSGFLLPRRWCRCGTCGEALSIW